jgi:hypothetical protein
MEFKSTAVAEQDPRRTVLRALLVLLAGLLAATLALPAGPLSGIVLAQEAEEEEEEAPAGPTIKFLNPSDYGEFRAVSDRDMEEHGYHLVATVHQPPANARVIFEAESASAGRRPIGIATREGPDTFGLHWQIPEASEFPRGSYTFRAILFTGNEQVSADEITASVQPNWPTVRLDHPSGGGGLGVYLPPGDNARWNTVVDYSFSSGTEIVAFFYSLTAPGRDLEWHHCGNVRVSSSPGGGASEPGSGRHLCELEEEHDGRRITAVAAVAADDPFPVPRQGDTPLFGDTSGDAHRVAVYRQLPVDVSLRVEGSEPGIEGPRSYETGSCTNQILALVTDQRQRPVARVNVDVHATGPEATQGRAALRFDVSTGTPGTDGNQPPDQNHQDETSAWSCANRQAAGPVVISGPGPAGRQGNHRNPDGPDTRHIESGPAGTNADGRFRFRLYNDEPGATQITAWTDLDNDDLYCGLEAAGHMAIGWNQAPPPVQGHRPERATCNIPGLQEILLAEATRHPRTVGINFRRAGGRLEVRGRVAVRTGHAPCARNVPVRVQRRVGNQWRTLRTVNTNRQRLYRARVADRRGRYRAVAPRVFKGNQHLCLRAAAQRRR